MNYESMSLVKVMSMKIQLQGGHKEGTPVC
jgi:hypothetical protein